MRQRKIKDIENKLLAYSDLLIASPAENPGKWRDVFLHRENFETNGEENVGSNSEERSETKGKKLCVEIGCGKGKFIATLAAENPDTYYVAVEGFSSVIIRAVDKARKLELNNLLFVQEFVYDLGTWFADGELDGIYLNFSDPWPKKKNAKRRLTYRDRLEQYGRALVPGGFIKIKTDNDEFFEFTLSEIAEYNARVNRMLLPKAADNAPYQTKSILHINALSRDLHNSEYRAGSPLTEYEAKFISAGKNINYIELIKSNK